MIRKLSPTEIAYSTPSNRLDYDELVRVVPSDTPKLSKAIFHPAAIRNETRSSASLESFTRNNFAVIREKEEFNIRTNAKRKVIVKFLLRVWAVV